MNSTNHQPPTTNHIYPVGLNLKSLPILLIGNGNGFKRREEQLIRENAKNLEAIEFKQENLENIKNLILKNTVILVVDIPEEFIKIIGDFARQHNKLINIEDVVEYCDFYYCSFFKRGDLLISVNTAGKNPTLTKRIRQYLEKLFPAVWQERLEEIAAARLKWLKNGATYKERIDLSNEYIDNKNWLK